LRGDCVTWPEAGDSAFQEQLRDLSLYHGVRPLLYQQLAEHPDWTSWPDDLRRLLQREARQRIALELLHKQELITVLDLLGQAGIRPLLLKGTPLAYTLYAAPSLRTRGDTDLLIRSEERETVARLLTDRGYRSPNAVSGELISRECCYGRKDDLGAAHKLDIHWDVSNRHLFAQALRSELLHAESVPVSALGENARTLGTVHALLLACLHRISHIHAPYYIGATPHYGPDRLIWLYDIHLLAAAMDRAGWERFAQAVEGWRFAGICLDGLRQTQRTLATRLPEDVIARLSAAAEQSELSAAYLRGGKLNTLVTNIRALPHWRERVALLKEHAFPPAPYMLAKYRTKNQWLLPLLYLRRAATGLGKLLR
jgi:hypothetical protein